jgi:hypothetical protein
LTVSPVPFELFSDDFFNAPYETYRRLRDEAAVYYSAIRVLTAPTAIKGRSVIRQILDTALPSRKMPSRNSVAETSLTR